VLILLGQVFYRYAESEDFEILLFGYSIDGKEVNVIDLTQGEKIPEEIIMGFAGTRKLLNGLLMPCLRGYVYQSF